jgi:bacterial/archaeal transporter family-2 protein
MSIVLLSAALVIGCLLAVQASVNIQLGTALGTPYGASTAQLMVATAILAVLALIAGALGTLGALPDATWWHLVGGLASPLYITSGILLFPRVGAVLSVGLFVTGQVFASLALDGGGLLDVPRRPLTAAMIAGAVAVLAGISTIVVGQRAGGIPVARAGWLGLGLVAGAALPVQGAVNARLRADLGEPLAVGLVSFAVATLTIVVVLLVLLAVKGTARPRVGALGTVPWWGWLGGACAAAYVTATFLLIPRIGAATTIALTVTGQQLASALIDHHGLFRLPRRPLTATRTGGLGLLVAGCLLVQLG